jgi:GNAT superfamily N-acetyltransferase
MNEAANSPTGPHAVHIRPGVLADAEPLATLINAAFRVEQPFIEGDRISPDGVRSYMEKGKFLLAEDSAGLAGCVYVELHGDHGYLGLLGIEPQRQGTGLGRKLMAEAEDFFRHAGYRHLGYVETGTAPFPHDVQSKVPCHYIIMSKVIA